MRRIALSLLTMTLAAAGCGGGNARTFGGESGGGSATHTGGAGGTGSGGTGGGAGAGSGGRGTGGGNVTGGTGGAPIPPSRLTAVAGYATNGVWSGYAYTATSGTTATISPVCPTPCFTGTNLCVSGTVAGDATLASAALLGWNIGQTMGTAGNPPAVRAVETSGAGLSITLSSAVTGGRIQLQDGASVPTRWCANLTTPSMMIPWSTFRRCADPAGAA